MVTTLDKGCYLVNGQTLIPADGEAPAKLSGLGITDAERDTAKIFTRDFMRT